VNIYTDAAFAGQVVLADKVAGVVATDYEGPCS